MGKRASFDPEKQSHGASYDDVDVEIVASGQVVGRGKKIEEAVTGTHLIDYINADGSVNQSNVPVATFVFKIDGGGADGGDVFFKEDYKAGDGKKIKATDDGESFEKIDGSDMEGINDASRLGQFFSHLKKSGAPEKLFRADNVKLLVGLKGHLRGVEALKVKGEAQKDIKVITKFTSYGGGSSSGAGGNVEAEAKRFMTIVVAKLAESGTATTKVKLAQAANKFFEKAANKGEIAAYILREEFLKTQDGWTYDGREVKAAAAAAEEVSL
jgi:hypothetical protein